MSGILKSGLEAYLDGVGALPARLPDTEQWLNYPVGKLPEPPAPPTEKAARPLIEIVGAAADEETGEGQ